MKILITGSSGTIGTRLWEKLIPEYDVSGLDIKQNDWQAAFNSGLNVIDLRNALALSGLTGKFDLVIHLAANARVYDLVEKPELAMDNILMTFNTLEYMRKNGIKKIIFASSRETYGNIMKGKAITEDAVRIENCESPYAASKITGEALLHAYKRSYDIDFTIIRFSNVYGMYDDSNRVVPVWTKQCLNNQDMAVFGKEKSLDFTYIDDAVDGVKKIIEKWEPAKGNTFNIAYGKEISLYEVAIMLKSLLKSKNNITFTDIRAGEVWKYEADISRARKLLGFNPQINIADGLQKSTDWYRQYFGGLNK